MDAVARLYSALPDPSAGPTYNQQVAVAVAAVATLIAMLVVIYLIVRITYRVLRAFTPFAFWWTAALVALFVLIGELNR
jgi:cell division protein FtsW (lipid II flippase)